MTWTILQADARQIPLADKSVQCVVTSPPYWGLRDYGTATWVGGDEGCDHKKPGANKVFGNPVFNENRPSREATETVGFRDACGKCGATRIDSQIGLEPTPEEYVAKIVAVFAEVWRVLRDDGTCWVNLGDSYAARLRQSGPEHAGELTNSSKGVLTKIVRDRPSGLKEKDLVGIPWRVAFALQAAGWYLRSDIIWSKPNPMPESVTDRPTKAHEYIFLLTKKERYYFDQDAVAEKLSGEPHAPGNLSTGRTENGNRYRTGGTIEPGRVWAANGTRNIRTVWEIATQPYPEAHFATFPEEIAIRCIKAGTSEKGACAECGAPWERVTERPKADAGYFTNTRQDDGFNVQRGFHADGKPRGSGQKYQNWLNENPAQTLGWQQTCKHDAPTVPCIVLDPFSGAGTVPLVADKLNRRGVGLELKSSYCLMASRRCYDDAPLLGGL